MSTKMVLVGSAGELDERVVDSMYQFRRQVFVKRLGWLLESNGGLERDQYDCEGTVYFISRDEQERVNACARLIPTTGPYMLPELFPQLLSAASPPADPSIWELSRFATSARTTKEGRVLSLSAPTLQLLSTVLHFAGNHGIAQLLFVTSIAMERLIVRTGLDVYRFVPPARIGDEICVALSIETAKEF